ncbi:MAG: hypothetical protein ABJF89_02065 [Parasphingorhabdus sp.]|uniref:hypothetical protein n=1 Tax=Parasphingorhabdus sp. TaxID=2709688 RepID=UPI0032675780
MIDTNDENMLLSRRTLMAGGVATGVAAGLPISAMASVATPPGSADDGALPADPATRAAIVRRMRLRHNAGHVFWWFRGTSYAQQGATLIPLCGMVFGSMIKVTPRDDGGLNVIQYELGFRTDLETGERLEKMRNPLTGQMIEIPFAPVGPTAFSYSATNDLILPEMIGGSRFTIEHIPELFYRAGDMVLFQYQSRATVETKGKPDRILNDLGNIYGPASEALDANLPTANAWVQGTDVTDYARWLQMPPGMGTQTLRSIGQKVFRFEDMPKDWLEMITKADPKMADDPLAVFDREEATYRN